MNNFVFHNPTKIVFGEGTVSQVGEHVKNLGKKVMLVYGQSSIKKNGIYEKVVDSLKSAGLKVIEFSGVKSNPVISHAREGIKLAGGNKVDFLLAVGGGSVIDETKAIAAGVLYDGDVWDFYSGKGEIKAALPVATILTIPAAGSEMNGGTVMTNEETKEKEGFLNEFLYPRVSILDPTVTYTIPADYTAYSAVDAMSHLIEGYFTHTEERAPIQERYVEGLVRTIMESTGIILENPTDYQARANMMWAASLAWNGLGTAGLRGAGVPVHALEHSLSGFYNIAHGAGLSILTPGWMTYMLDEKKKRFARFTENVFKIKLEDDESTAKSGIAELKGWFDKIGSPTSFKAANVPSTELEELAGDALKRIKAWGIEGYSKEMIVEIFKMCL